MIIEQFLINKTKEINNPISNWGIGFTAEVIQEWIDLQIKVKKLTIPVVIVTVCPKCKGDQIADTKTGYLCCYTDCSHEWQTEL
jgi:hypothetical protein